MASPSRKLVCNQVEMANPAVSIVLPIPSELVCSQDEDGGGIIFTFSPPWTKRWDPIAPIPSRNATQEPHHIYRQVQTTTPQTSQGRRK